MLADRIEALRNRRANILGHEQSLKTAVLLPLVERDGKICILFEKRSHTLQHQPGEICFPGGMKDPDDPQALDTAIRETCEELGITPDNIEVIGELDTLITPSSLIMRSFVAWIKDSSLIQVNPDILMRLSSQMARRLQVTSEKVGNLAFLDVTGRIAQTLLNLAKQPDAMTHPDGMQIKITRQEIGQIVGCSRETVGRILKMLEDQNLISAHGKTIVVYGTR